MPGRSWRCAMRSTEWMPMPWPPVRAGWWGRAPYARPACPPCMGSSCCRAVMCRPRPRPASRRHCRPAAARRLLLGRRVGRGARPAAVPACVHAVLGPTSGAQAGAGAVSRPRGLVLIRLTALVCSCCARNASPRWTPGSPTARCARSGCWTGWAPWTCRRRPPTWPPARTLTAALAARRVRGAGGAASRVAGLHGDGHR